MQNLSPFGWAIRPLRRYADFQGRSSRAEYWWFFTLQWILMMLLVFFAVFIAGGTQPGDTNPLFGAFIIPVLIGFSAVLIPNIAVQVRRLHDQDRSGWMILLFIIPYVGGLLSIVFMCIRGTNGPNRFGPDPYGDGADQLTEIFA
jgi:uncharacterized membrane protein YhaH (DUF805 family)